MKSREDINSYRRGERVVTCGVLEHRASVFLEASGRGLITPQVVVQRRALAMLIGLPCCLFFVITYLALSRRATAPSATRRGASARSFM